jgi:hypothetical protein
MIKNIIKTDERPVCLFLFFLIRYFLLQYIFYGKNCPTQRVLDAGDSGARFASSIFPWPNPPGQAHGLARRFGSLPALQEKLAALQRRNYS